MIALSTSAAGLFTLAHGAPPSELVPGEHRVPVPAGTRAAPRQPVADQYVVVFRDRVTDAPGLARRLVSAHGGSLRFAYAHALKGFAARLPQAAVAALARNPNVDYIEQDQVMNAITTQSNATWGLDRSDQRALPLNGAYTYTPTGQGVRAYIVDTGIRLDHAQFGGRAVSGTDVIDGGAADDCNGHGTHVAGTVGGATYGVAKAVRLVAIRVLDCNGSGTTSGVIAGIDWITANHVKPAVANMSLGGGASTALDDAVRRSIAKGVTYAVAAGNDAADACYYSPARVAEAVTVGATTASDGRASYSNSGSCLDLFAPGTSITSAWHTGSNATATISGTSMATPHVTGVAALYLEQDPAASPSTVAKAIVNTATANVVTAAGSGSPNKLLYAPLTASDGSESTAPCTTCTAYAGSLAGAGDYDYQPDGSYYYSSRSGYHTGWIEGPSGANFDLYLYKWNGSSWAVVASARASTSSEKLSYYGSAGYYLWMVYSASGSGAYSFWLQRP
jgi:subtilisin family serine protease